METSMSASASFDAGHSIADIPQEIRNHGHHWTVTATVVGDLDPKTGWPRGTEQLSIDLFALVGEWRGRDLDEMLPDVVTSPLGIAMHALERLALRYPKISSVEVACSDGTSGRIVRSPR